MSQRTFVGLALILLLAASPGLAQAGGSGPPPVGLWLKHAWMEEEHSAEELSALARHLMLQEVTHVYVHIGPYNTKGLITRYKEDVVRSWLKTLKREAPGVARLAWLGGRGLANGGTVDLTSATYRKSMVEEAVSLLEKFDFDGVHLNIEPLEETDLDFLLFLQDLRKALDGKLISFAAPKLRPWWVPGAFGISQRYWRSEAFSRIMPYLDQIVVMVYDTGVPTSGLYQKYVASNVEALREAHRAGGRPQCQLLVGLPSYDQPTFFHKPAVENLEFGLIGFLLGVTNSPEPDDPAVGVAIYANWTTEDSEWETYRHIWLDRFAEKR